MLVVHPSSSCDICVEDYELDNLAKSPHAIDCGHVLCLTCIFALVPGVCPLCRTEFQTDNVRKLFVDAPPAEEDSAPSAPDTQASILLEQLALVSESDSSTEDVLGVIKEVKDWLSKEDDADDMNKIVPLRSALHALIRLKVLASELDNNPAVSEELETARAVEQSLLSQLEEERAASQASREDVEYHLRSAQDNVQLLRIDNDRLSTTLREERAEMNILRSECQASERKTVELLQTSQAKENSLFTHIRDIETKYTSKLSTAESEIVSLRTEVSQLRNTINVLRASPPPPPPPPPPPSQQDVSLRAFYNIPNSIGVISPHVPPFPAEDTGQNMDYQRNANTELQGRLSATSPNTATSSRNPFAAQPALVELPTLSVADAQNRYPEITFADNTHNIAPLAGYGARLSDVSSQDKELPNLPSASGPTLYTNSAWLT